MLVFFKNAKNAIIFLGISEERKTQASVTTCGRSKGVLWEAFLVSQDSVCNQNKVLRAVPIAALRTVSNLPVECSETIALFLDMNNHQQDAKSFELQ